MTWRKGLRAAGPADQGDAGLRPVTASCRLLEVRVDADRALPGLLGVVVLLTAASYSGQLLTNALQGDLPWLTTAIRSVDVALRGNLPSWVRLVLMLVDCLVLWTVADDAKIRGDGWSRHWRVLALVAAVLSLDELAEIHGWVITAIRVTLHVSDFFFFAWVIPAILLVAAAGLVLGQLVQALPRRTGLGLTGAVALYLGGAACLDVFRAQLAAVIGPHPMIVTAVITGAQASEMVGLVVLLVTTARYGQSTWQATADRGPGEQGRPGPVLVPDGSTDAGRRSGIGPAREGDLRAAGDPWRTAELTAIDVTAGWPPSPPADGGGDTARFGRPRPASAPVPPASPVEEEVVTTPLASVPVPSEYRRPRGR